MRSIIANCQSVSAGQYCRYLRDEVSLPDDFISSNAWRINRAYEMGEPLWMIAAELKMVYSTVPVAKPAKLLRAR